MKAAENVGHTIDRLYPEFQHFEDRLRFLNNLLKGRKGLQFGAGYPEGIMQDLINRGITLLKYLERIDVENDALLQIYQEFEETNPPEIVRQARDYRRAIDSHKSFVESYKGVLKELVPRMNVFLKQLKAGKINVSELDAFVDSCFARLRIAA